MGIFMYLPWASAATVPSSSTISPVPSKIRLALRVMRPIALTSLSIGTGLRNLMVNSTVTPQV